jgi:hypothetical protein
MRGTMASYRGRKSKYIKDIQAKACSANLEAGEVGRMTTRQPSQPSVGYYHLLLLRRFPYSSRSRIRDRCWTGKSVLWFVPEAHRRSHQSGILYTDAPRLVNLQRYGVDIPVQRFFFRLPFLKPNNRLQYHEDGLTLLSPPPSLVRLHWLLCLTLRIKRSRQVQK